MSNPFALVRHGVGQTSKDMVTHPFFPLPFTWEQTGELAVVLPTPTPTPAYLPALNLAMVWWRVSTILMNLSTPDTHTTTTHTGLYTVLPHTTHLPLHTLPHHHHLHTHTHHLYLPALHTPTTSHLPFTTYHTHTLCHSYSCLCVPVGWTALLHACTYLYICGTHTPLPTPHILFSSHTLGGTGFTLYTSHTCLPHIPTPSTTHPHTHTPPFLPHTYTHHTHTCLPAPPAIPSSTTTTHTTTPHTPARTRLPAPGELL